MLLLGKLQIERTIQSTINAILYDFTIIFSAYLLLVSDLDDVECDL